MLEFRELLLSDREAIHQNLYTAAGHGSEYSFANLFFWGEQRVAFHDGIPLLLSRFGSLMFYLCPICADLRPLLRLLREDARARGIPFRLFGLLPQEAARLPADYCLRTARDSADYVYDITRLCDLRGKRLQAKRNYCNRFEEQHPDYRVLTLTRELLPRCADFTERWYLEHEALHNATDFAAERAAIDRAFRHFDELGMEGVAIDTPDGLVAFSMGNRIREDTFDVNFEKALAQVPGAYPIVNRAFARQIHAAYPAVRFLNREDDMGIPGLRRAKESYFPDRLLHKLIAEAAE